VSVVGSALTVAYMLRFFWGAFALKSDVPRSGLTHDGSPDNYVAPAVLALLALLGGVAAPLFDPAVPAAAGAPATPGPAHWHGPSWALGATVLALLAGAIAAGVVIRHRRPFPALPERYSASHAYWVLTHWLDIIAVRLTAATQRGSLPFYLAVVLV